jgi:hypothetical protein
MNIYKADITPKECENCRTEHGKLWQFFSRRTKSFTPTFAKIKDIDSRWCLYQCPKCSNLLAWDTLSGHTSSYDVAPRYKFLAAEDLAFINQWHNRKWALNSEQKTFLKTELPAFYPTDPPGEISLPCQITTQDNKVFQAGLTYSSNLIPINNKWQTKAEPEAFKFQFVVFIDEIKKIERSPYAFPLEVRKNFDKYYIPGEERLRADAIHFYCERLKKTLQFSSLPGLFQGNGVKGSELIPITADDKRCQNVETAKYEEISDVILVVCPTN